MTTVSQTLIGDAGDLMATPGSQPWAVALRLELVALLHNASSSAQRLERLTALMHEHHGYRHLRDPHGEPFDSFAAFCAAPEPYGLGMDAVAIDTLIRERIVAQSARERVRAAARETTGVHRGRGSAPRGIELPASLAERARQRGVSSATQHKLDQLATHRPDLLEQVQRGELSVHAAARAAGLVRATQITVLLDPVSAAQRLKYYLDADGQAALIAALQSPDVRPARRSRRGNSSDHER